MCKKNEAWEYFYEMYYFDEQAATLAVERIKELPEDIKQYMRNDVDDIPNILSYVGGFGSTHNIGYEFARAIRQLI